jgi:cell division protein FtsQ
VDTKIAERRAEVRRERMLGRRRRVKVAIVVFVVAAVLIAIERSPLLAVSSVEVAGTERIPEVVEAADLPVGTSTLRLRVRQAQDRVEGLAFVRDATVRRVDPLTVRIEVDERLPVLAVSNGERSVLVDEDGIVVDDAPPGQLPLVRTPGDPLPSPGEEIERRTAAANAFAVHAGLPGPMRSVVQRYEATGPDDVELLLDQGVTVQFGRAERVAEKARVLGALLRDVGPDDVVDVRAPANPVVLPADADTSVVEETLDAE